MTNMKMSLLSDLSLMALNAAAAMMGVTELTYCVLITTVSNRLAARRLQGECGFEVRIVPDCLLFGPRTWALYHEMSDSTVWNEGI
jgi:hypothetical protein